MPMPRPGCDWPPAPIIPALTDMATWSAWWTGDAVALESAYSQGFANRPAQHAGGIVGRAARMWWGRPAPANEPTAKLHIPLAADLCRAGADLLFSEPITATSDDAPTQDRLDELLDDGMQATLLSAAETCAALGGIYLRPVYDRTIADHAWIDAVSPEGALPEWRWGRLVGVAFWRQIQARDGQVWRHVEHHDVGWITHGLYQGTDTNLGRLVPLDDVEDTARLATLVDADSRTPSGWDRLHVAYIPHALPNTRWRKYPLLAPMGRSALDGCEPMLDALDEIYSSWMRDVRLAKGRVHVPSGMLDDHGPGKGASWDPDREVYSEIPGSLATRDSTLTVTQFAIRVAEHRDSAAELIEAIARHAGYSLRTLGMQRDGAPVTATEVTAGERRSFITRDRQIGQWRPALLQTALPALLALDTYAFGRPPMRAGVPLRLDFADSVSVDLLTLANTVDVLARAQAASVETKVRIVHPDWDEGRVVAEVAAIRQDGAPGMVAPFDVDQVADQRATA